MKPFAAFATLAALLFFSPLVGTLVGAFSGWVVGLFFAETVLDFLHRAGVNTIGLPMWQVGAALGFLGGFFRASVSAKAQ